MSSILTPGIVNQMSLSATFLKLVACAAMLADHIGLLFFPDILWWRVIGRVAFPLFALLIAEGFMRTKSFRNYFMRLLGFAALSHIPYFLFLDAAGRSTDKLNIFFTLAAGLLALLLLKKLPVASSLPLIVITAIIAEWLGFDYGAYGILTILASAFFLEHRPAGAVELVLLPLVYTVLTLLNVGYLSIQAVALFAVPLMLLYRGELGIRIHRMFFYSFYPVHLLILWLISVSIS